LNDLWRKSVAFVQRFGSIHSAIVAQPPLICQYRQTHYRIDLVYRRTAPPFTLFRVFDL
jgi:hypothetical protein